MRVVKKDRHLKNASVKPDPLGSIHCTTEVYTDDVTTHFQALRSPLSDKQQRLLASLIGLRLEPNQHIPCLHRLPDGAPDLGNDTVHRRRHVAFHFH